VSSTRKINLKACVIFMMLVSTLSFAVDGTDTPASSNETETTMQQGRTTGSVFMPGDAMQVSVFPDTASFLNGVFSIDDRGYVDLPIYGKTRISQMSQSDLERFLVDKYKDYLRYPTLKVKPLIRISVLGGVAQPGLFHIDPDNSIWDAMKLAGGPTDEDGLKQMHWKRNKEKVVDNLIPIYQEGSSLRTIGFKSGDQIWVRTPNKPGFFDKTRDFLGLVTASASVVALIFTYQRLATDRR